MASDQRLSVPYAQTADAPVAENQDAQLLEELGYTQELKRTLSLFENFAASFCTLNIIGGTRGLFFVGLLAGGPLAMWITSVLTAIFLPISGAILAEICSAIPVSGSIYIWAAEAAYAGDGSPANASFARFIGFICAWWAAAAWMGSPAIWSQLSASFMVSILSMYNIDFPGGISNNNIKWRAVMWIMAEISLFLAVVPNYINTRWLKVLFRFVLGVMVLDFVLCLVWLPIGVHKTYGFRTGKEALLTTNNGTGAPSAWNFLLSFVFCVSSPIGFDAAGHVSEETKKASHNASRGVFWSGLIGSVQVLVLTILFLFCTPDINTLLALEAPQPFTVIYSLALGRNGAVFMTVLAIIGLIGSASTGIVASSRLVYAIARDGPLPMGKWVSRVENGHPVNAITVVYGFSALLLCTILPSTSAFTSLMSAGATPIMASYGLIALLRLTVTPGKYLDAPFSLGKFRLWFYAIAVVFDGFIVAILVSPFFYPVTAQNFNFASVIFSTVTICGILSWWRFPSWLKDEAIKNMSG